MRIEDRFTVSLPVDQAWQTFLDVERIAPCMPGAQLQEVEGDEYRGVVKVKLGAITAQFKGAARFTEVDESARRVVLRAQGREVRGQGNATATVTATLNETSEGGTEVAIDTDLSISGRVAQFGRGVLADVSSKLLGDFARCLEDRLVRGEAATEAPPAAAAAEAPPPPVTTEAPPPAAETPPTRRTVQSAPAEPVDLLAVAGPSVTARGLPAGIVAVLVLLAASKRPAVRWLLALAGSALVGVLARGRRAET